MLRFSITRAFPNHILRLPKVQISPPQRFASTTTTAAIDKEKIFTTTVETAIEPVDSLCTPSTQKKIYPTRQDDYDSIPVVVDGQEIVVNRSEVADPWPLIPTLEVDLVEADGDEAAADKWDASEPTVHELMNVEFAANMPTINDDKNPERDAENFPVQSEIIARPNYRLGFIPESLFKQFYNKTGVTGPYAFLFTTGTFLISKELIVCEDSFIYGCTFLGIVAFALHKFGSIAERKFTAQILKQRQGWLDWQEGSIEFLKNYIGLKKSNIASYQNIAAIQDIKKANVNLQREAEYRRRLMTVYNEAIRKLNYHVAVDEAKRQFSKRHMANWIIDNAYASITAQSKKAALEQSVLELKQLATKKAKVI